MSAYGRKQPLVTVNMQAAAYLESREDGSISAAELTELWLMSQSEINAQFEFWLTVSFAVIVASLSEGNALTET